MEPLCAARPPGDKTASKNSTCSKLVCSPCPIFWASLRFAVSFRGEQTCFSSSVDKKLAHTCSGCLDTLLCNEIQGAADPDLRLRLREEALNWG